MSASVSLKLAGCSPVPLAHYLKALGILRLVSEQKDLAAKGRWSRDQFILESSLDHNGILDFFLNEYQPTPILSPWNADGGFFLGSRPGSRKTLESVAASASERLAPYRSAISEVKKVLIRYGIVEKPSDDNKEKLLLACRNSLPDKVLAWIDATSVLTDDGAKYPPLLGTGGNDGSSDFSKNWMLVLSEVFDFASGKSTIPANDHLRVALFAESAPAKTIDAPIGQFLPGSAGGSNLTSGFKADPKVNPWDFILMIEGALLFAAANVKRLESFVPGMLSAPFCVRQAGVGYASAAAKDEESSVTRGEIWMPLWNTRAVTLAELSAIFSEGRAQVGGRAARNGVDFARAVVGLGVDRGIDEFQRYGFQVRNGLSYFATPLTRVVAKKNAATDLLNDVDAWLERYRRAATKDTAPASARRVLSLLESAMIDLCVSNTSERLMRVFTALGRCEATAAKSLKWANENYLQPLTGLRKAWLQHGWHRTEFRLAASLASIRGRFGQERLPLRAHLEPVETYYAKDSGAQAYRWADVVSNHVQWSEGALPDVLNDILARRLILTEDVPQRRSEVWASMEDIKAFIEGATDDALLADLIWSMSLINWREEGAIPSHTAQRVVPPTLYALLKLCFPTARKSQPEDILQVPVVPGIHRHAAEGNGTQTAALAIRRLRASGYHPVLRQLSAKGDAVKRTAAALLFPISDFSLKDIYRQINRPEREPETEAATA